MKLCELEQRRYYSLDKMEQAQLKKSLISKRVLRNLQHFISNKKYVILVLFCLAVVTEMLYGFQVSSYGGINTTNFPNKTISQTIFLNKKESFAEETFISILRHSYQNCTDKNCDTRWLNTKQYHALQRNYASGLVKSTNVRSENVASLSSCPETPPGLVGRKDASPLPNIPPLYQATEKENPLVSDGGHYKPPNCIARWKVAIIIPFRNRDTHLQYFLHYMHPILQRQQLDYRIYVINQFGTGTFNRAKLFNVGFVEAIKDYDFQCFVFHDVDLILENDNVLYSCPDQPRHLASAVSKFQYQMAYGDCFGGASELTKEQFEKVNGFSNKFWGWGGEDDEFLLRIRAVGMNVIRYPIEISRYLMFSHNLDVGNEANEQRFRLLKFVGLKMKRDGLNSLNYKRLYYEKHPLYTNLTVDITS